MTSRAVLPDARGSRAVLIGTHRYDHEDFLDLPAVENNLQALATLLAGATSWELPAENCTTLLNPVHSEDVLNAVYAAAEAATDALLIYYSGHGFTNRRGELFLALTGTRPVRPHTGLPYEAIREALFEAQAAARRVVILDCCFGGRALGMGTAQDVAAAAEVEGTYLLAAAGETQTAWAEPGEAYTAFTGELLKLLHDGLPEGPSLLDLDVVYDHLRAQLRANSLPMPHKRDRNTAGRIALARNRAHPSASPPPGPPPITPIPGSGGEGGGSTTAGDAISRWIMSRWIRVLMAQKPALMAGLATAVAAVVALIVAASGTFGFWNDDQPSASCPGWSRRDADERTGTIIGAGNLNDGPYSYCGNVVWMSAGDSFHYGCYLTNSYGHSWTYGRMGADGAWGWVSADHLDDRGSQVPCDATGKATEPG